MITKIDTTAYFLTEICEEILSLLARRIETDSIFEVVKECVISNKEQIGLDRYWIDGCSKKFWVEFLFRDERYSYRVCFSEMDSTNNLYHVTDVSPYIIVTRPLRLQFDGLMYCGTHHRILYVDYFTKWVPLDDEDMYLSVHELIEGNRNDIECKKKDSFISFYERLSEREKKELNIANIDFWKLDDIEGDNYKYLMSRIYDEAISCVVTSDIHFPSKLKLILPPYISLIVCNDRVPPLSRQQWVYRAVAQIRQMLTMEQQDSHNTAKEYWKWLSVMIKDYNIPKRMLREACSQLLDGRDFYFHRFGYL